MVFKKPKKRLKKIVNRKTPEQRQASRLQRLKTVRIREEGRAKLNILEQKELDKIARARRTKPKRDYRKISRVKEGIGKGLDILAKGSKGFDEFVEPKKKKKRKRKGEMLDMEYELPEIF